jgi:hypothetical protein
MKKIHYRGFGQFLKVLGFVALNVKNKFRIENPSVTRRYRKITAEVL